MSSFKTLAFAGALAAAATVQAHAADLGYPPPPVLAPPPAALDASGWYLRGDIGITNQSVSKITNVLDATTTSLSTVQKSFDSSPLFGVGAGYKFNSWLRADVTGEYRSKANFHGQQIGTSGGAPLSDVYTASKSEWTGLVNGYIDLGTWYSITPFVGAGIGWSHNTIHDFTDLNVPNGGVAFGKKTSKDGLAWALHAGLSYQVTPGFSVELAYRYMNLGSAQSGDLQTFNGINNINNPEKFHDLTSNDVKIGMRWMLNDTGPTPVSYAAPLVRKY